VRLALISPRLALQKGDFLGSGVPYWPVELATLASHARGNGDDVSLIDLFGNAPHQFADAGDHYLQGHAIEHYLDDSEVKHAEAFVLYAISYMSHRELLTIVRTLKKSLPRTPIAVLENSQAVTAYSLQRVAAAYFEAGANLLICGEPYFNWDAIKRQLVAQGNDEAGYPRNVITPWSNPVPQRITVQGAIYPVPAWDLVNLAGYWSLPYAHGPKTPRYLPVLTSRGCPYPCDFCVVPETNDRRWRGNSPEQVVEEFIALRDRFAVHDFQVEDLNPTVRHERWERISEILIERNANIRFYFVSGTKAETVRLDKVPMLARAGCRYISISPESGSGMLMKRIGKRFDYDHGLALIAACRDNNIRTQACMLVGHPHETKQDFHASRDYLRRMVDAGLDEVAVFVVASFAGSALYAQSVIAVSDASALPSFSPKGRPEYLSLLRRRRELIRIFMLGKLSRGGALWMQGFRALAGRPQTKMENLPLRIAYVYWHLLRYICTARSASKA
jgi:hypothetical protein